MSLRKQSSIRMLEEAQRSFQTPKLRKTLNPWQIFFIAVSGLVGTGVFSSNGSVLKIAGPGGYLLALGIVGIIAIAFMECLSELIQAFPCANSLSEYVDIFIDPELASIVGVAYWLTWGIYWALMISAAGQYASSWHPGAGVIIAVFFVICPLVTTGVNLVHVSLFGWIETLGGLIKTVAILAVSLTVYYLAGQTGSAPSNLAEGFVQKNDWHTQAVNVCAVLPLVAYSWIGLEIVAVTAFEAKSYTDLRAPSQILPYFVFALYFICAVGESLALPWNAPLLPAPDKREQPLSPDASSGSILSPSSERNFSSTAAVIIAATQVGQDRIAQVFNGVLIFCALSAGNTCLYVASRTLYGFAFNDRRRNSCGLRKLAQVTKRGVPKYAVILTAVVFGWLPFLTLAPEPGNVQASFSAPVKPQILTVSIVFRMVGHCRQFERSFRVVGGVYSIHPILALMYRFKGTPVLTQDNPSLNRFNAKTRHAQTVLGFLQPLPAYLGAVGSLLILLIFSSGFFWQKPATGFLVTQTFFVPIVVPASWVVLKFLRRYNPRSKHEFAWYTVWPEGQEGLQRAFDKLVLASGHMRMPIIDGHQGEDIESTTEVVEIVEEVEELPGRPPMSTVGGSSLSRQAGILSH